MKKTMAMAVLVVGLLLAIVGTAVGQEPTIKRINEMKEYIIVINGDKFPNPNLLQPGDTVCVTHAETGSCAKAYKVEKWMTESARGCIWQIAKLHLQHLQQPENELRVLPSATPSLDRGMISKPEVRPDFPWLSLLGLIVCLALVGLLAFYYFRHRIQNPDEYPPVITNGLNQDPTQAIAQIAHAYPSAVAQPGNPIQRVERGRLIRLAGPRSILVNMTFADGQRGVRMHHGDSAYRVTLQNNQQQYFRTHCGNLFAPIASGQFTLPTGWQFLVEATHNVSTPAQTTVQPTTAQTPAPAPGVPAPEAEQVEAKTETQAEDNHSITVEIGNGDNKITVKAEGSAANMPTKVEHVPGQKTVIYFPRDPEK